MTLTGKLIEIGDLEHLQDGPEPKSGVVILVDREQLKASPNLFGEIVTIEKSKKIIMPIQQNNNSDDSDGFVIASSFTNSRQEMSFRIRIGEIIEIKQQEYHPVSEGCLGKWSFAGFNPDGTMKLVRYQ